MQLRGLFGSSARQSAPFVGVNPNSFTEDNTAMRDQPVVQAPAGAPDPGPAVRSYLGGLVKYQRPEGQTGGDRMQLVGATLQDIAASLAGGQGGSLEAVQEGFRKRQAAAEKQSLMKRLEDMAGELYPDDEEARLLFKLNPEAFVESRLEARKPKDPTYVEGPNGIYERGENGWSLVQTYPERERDVPSGMVRNPDTGRLEWEPGYLEAQLALANGRRDIVVDNPMPSRARPSGDHRATAPATGPSAAVPPWKRTW